MKTFMLIVLIVCFSGCCRILPDWVSLGSENQCMMVETEECPAALRFDGYCCPEECVCGNECECASTEAFAGSQEHLNDGTCCPDGTHAVWIRNSPEIEMRQVCR